MTNGAGKVALVTGADRGLGTHVSRAFLGAGIAVAGLSPTIRQSAFDHPAFTAIPAEISSAEPAKTAVEGAMARLGRIDILAHLVGGFSRAAEDPGAGVGAYSASKAALVSLIRTVALEDKDAGITTNCVAARHHGYSGKPAGYAEPRPRKVGAAGLGGFFDCLETAART